jgi:predicted GTPase
LHAVANTNTPVCVFANMPQYVKEPYKRYLENKIRDNWDFQVFQLIFILERIVIEKISMQVGIL